MELWIAALAGSSFAALIGFALREFIHRQVQPDYERMIQVPNTTPVLLAVTRRLPGKERDIVIVRRAKVKPHDVVLVRPRALEASLLARAVYTLQLARRESGRIPTQDALLGVPAAGTQEPPRVEEAIRWVDSLHRAKPMRVPGVGIVPLLILHVFDEDPNVPQKGDRMDAALVHSSRAR